MNGIVQISAWVLSQMVSRTGVSSVGLFPTLYTWPHSHTGKAVLGDTVEIIELIF